MKTFPPGTLARTRRATVGDNRLGHGVAGRGVQAPSRPVRPPIVTETDSASGEIAAPGQWFGLLALGLATRAVGRRRSRGSARSVRIMVDPCSVISPLSGFTICTGVAEAESRSGRPLGAQVTSTVAFAPLKDEAVVLVVQQHPAQIDRMLAEMADHLRQRGVGRARDAFADRAGPSGRCRRPCPRTTGCTRRPARCPSCRP